MEGEQAWWEMTCQQLPEENTALSEGGNNLRSGQPTQLKSINLSVMKATGLFLDKPDREENKSNQIKSSFNCQKIVSRLLKKRNLLHIIFTIRWFIRTRYLTKRFTLELDLTQVTTS